MNKLKNKTGATLAELLIAVIISAVLALSVGVISFIGVGTSGRYETEMALYSDIAYGFKLMQKQVREMYTAGDPLAASGSWISERLFINHQTGADSVFGLYNNAATNSMDFVFVPDQSNEAVREVLLSVPNPATFTLDFTRSGNKYTVDIAGEKNRVPFEMQTVILMRRG